MSRRVYDLTDILDSQPELMTAVFLIVLPFAILAHAAFFCVTFLWDRITGRKPWDDFLFP